MLVRSTVRGAAVKSDDRATVAALRRWLELQNGEREFYCNDYHAGDYVFTFEDGRPPHPDTTASDSTASPRPRITFMICATPTRPAR